MGEGGSIADPSLRYILHATGYDASSLLRISDNSGTQHIFSLTGVYLGMSAGAGTAVAYLRDEEGRVGAIVASARCTYQRGVHRRRPCQCYSFFSWAVGALRVRHP